MGHVGHYSRGTSKDEVYEWSSDGENIGVIDLPGLGDSRKHDKDFASIYREWVPKADAFLIVTNPPRPIAYGTLRTINLLLSNKVPPAHIIIGINRLGLLRDDDGPFEMNGIAGPRSERDRLMIQELIDVSCEDLNKNGNRRAFVREQFVPYDAESGWNLYAVLNAVLSTLPDDVLPHWQQAIDESGKEYRTKRGAELAEELRLLKERRAALRKAREELARERERLESERKLRIEAERLAAAQAEKAAATRERRRQRRAAKRHEKQLERERRAAALAAEVADATKREIAALKASEAARQKAEAANERQRLADQEALLSEARTKVEREKAKRIAVEAEAAAAAAKLEAEVAAERQRQTKEQVALVEARAQAEAERVQRLIAEAEAEAAREEAEEARRKADEERIRRSEAERQAALDRAHVEKERRIVAEEEAQRLREAELERQEQDLEARRAALDAQENEKLEHDRRLGGRIARWIGPIIGDARAEVVAVAVHKVGGFLAKVARALLG